MNNIFAIAFIPDKKLGLFPAPYLLEQDADSNYKVYKRLTMHDINLKIVLENSWIKKIIELSDALSNKVLNSKVNKNHKKTDIYKFLEDANKETNTYVNNLIDRKKIEIVKIIQQKNIPIFIKTEKLNIIYKEKIIRISQETAHVKFDFEKKAETLHYKLKLYINDILININNKNISIVTNKVPSIIYKNKLVFFDNEDFNGNKIRPFLKKDEIVVNSKMEGLFFSKFIAPVVKKFEYNISGFDFTEISTKILPQLLIEKTFLNSIIITPVFWYRKNKVEYYKAQNVFITVVEKNKVYSLERISRDLIFEKNLLIKLKKIGFEEKEKHYHIKNAPTDIHSFTEFFQQYISKINKIGFSINNKLFKTEVVQSLPQLKYSLHQKQDWFDLYIKIKIGEYEIDFIEIKHHILTKNNEFILPDGSVLIIPSAWFAELYPFAKRTDNNNLSKIHKTQLGLFESNKLIQPDELISNQLLKIEINKTNVKLPILLEANLRDYQKTGFSWLYQLTQNGYGACLADDMGLGKTLQVICLLLKYFEETSFENSPKQQPQTNQLSLFSNSETIIAAPKQFSSALIVVPKSLVFNWIDEIIKFAPKLTYVVYHGNNRQKILQSNIHKTNIIITTYGMVRTDIDELKKHDFSYIIADESQAIKNPQSKVFNAMMQLQANSRITITGTPIENGIVDLWAQMSFLNHNILGNMQYFDKTYVKPIKADYYSNETEELKKITSPFILRRLKKDVAKELPEKTEQIVFCDMYDSQKELYETEKSSIRNEILFTKEKNAIAVLAMLNKLRQIAIHPNLINKSNDIPSGKFDSIIHTIHNLIEQGHKFLIFSSFVKHLQLFENYFIDNNISYAMLTGSSNNRKKIVDDYQNSDSIKPFLISIKAGGVGLNITSASYVLIIDPWWNPFVEQQAINRTHRIGQTQKVVVYKFITKNSIEEKMMNLQKSKIKISGALINAGNNVNINLADITKLTE